MSREELDLGRLLDWLDERKQALKDAPEGSWPNAPPALPVAAAMQSSDRGLRLPRRPVSPMPLRGPLGGGSEAAHVHTSNCPEPPGSVGKDSEAVPDEHDAPDSEPRPVFPDRETSFSPSTGGVRQEATEPGTAWGASVGESPSFVKSGQNSWRPSDGDETEPSIPHLQRSHDIETVTKLAQPKTMQGPISGTDDSVCCATPRLPLAAGPEAAKAAASAAGSQIAASDPRWKAAPEGYDEEMWHARQKVTGASARMVHYGAHEFATLEDDFSLQGGGRERWITVNYVKREGKAQAAGVRVGDVLVSIDGSKAFQGHTSDVIIRSLRPPVTLVFMGFVGKAQAEVRIAEEPNGTTLLSARHRLEFSGLGPSGAVVESKVVQEVVFTPRDRVLLMTAAHEEASSPEEGSWRPPIRQSRPMICAPLGDTGDDIESDSESDDESDHGRDDSEVDESPKKHVDAPAAAAMALEPPGADAAAGLGVCVDVAKTAFPGTAAGAAAASAQGALKKVVPKLSLPQHAGDNASSSTSTQTQRQGGGCSAPPAAPLSARWPSQRQWEEETLRHPLLRTPREHLDFLTPRRSAALYELRSADARQVLAKAVSSVQQEMKQVYSARQGPAVCTPATLLPMVPEGLPQCAELEKFSIMLFRRLDDKQSMANRLGMRLVLWSEPDSPGEPSVERLIVKDVGPGLVDEWNRKACEENRVQLGDTLVEVNGVQGVPARLLDEITKAAKMGTGTLLTFLPTSKCTPNALQAFEAAKLHQLGPGSSGPAAASRGGQPDEDLPDSPNSGDSQAAFQKPCCKERQDSEPPLPPHAIRAPALQGDSSSDPGADGLDDDDDDDADDLDDCAPAQHAAAAAPSRQRSAEDTHSSPGDVTRRGSKRRSPKRTHTGLVADSLAAVQEDFMLEAPLQREPEGLPPHRLALGKEIATSRRPMSPLGDECLPASHFSFAPPTAEPSCGSSAVSSPSSASPSPGGSSRLSEASRNSQRRMAI
eukprot:TRINITY_DN50424_c0_g1_i1.p1 TRINITY_DN50424_c0_g1~~TRINITY_DN50424_c0_g1_i1.p1  ORF type:complete len:992 (-),score=226.92 TRINITY_DN50424_c0_g1_i1:206-3181(-)